ncbi:MAG TPA: hypothetical protein VF701_05565 [Thermoanaerobaculia bacterium]
MIRPIKRGTRNMKEIRYLYRSTDGTFGRVGSVSVARLWAFEYEPVAGTAFKSRLGEGDDTIRAWRTRRPDLAPPELWLGDEVALAEELPDFAW